MEESLNNWPKLTATQVSLKSHVDMDYVYVYIIMLSTVYSVSPIFAIEPPLNHRKCGLTGRHRYPLSLLKAESLQDSEDVSYDGTESSGLKLINYRLVSQTDKSIVAL